MYPELLHLGNLTLHAYGFFIAVGAYLGFTFVSREAKRDLGVEPQKTSTLFFIIVAAAFVGGKFLFYLEDPGHYFGTPANMFKNIGNGFVFFGSLLFVIPVVAWYFRKHKIPTWPMLDLLGITACIVHAFGRIGCFMAGCCHGIPTDSWVGVTFTDPNCSADPLNTPLHPTQLYEVLSISAIGLFLWWLKKRKRFDGQVFLVYLVLYSIARSIIEIYRGDEERGYIIEDWLSHSQLISLLLIAVVAVVYRLRSRGKLAL